MRSSDIRKQFIDFFLNKEHHFVRSSSVAPLDDPTLLFTNAGMNQFKDIFLDKIKPKYNRAVNSQKCIRVSGKHNDLEEVGVDNYHHTFFEMLGNWSFGDYYKEEAINWAWELITKEWKLDKNRLWITIYKDDDESYNLWNKINDLDSDRILKFGDKDNFWEMGETGPCGPCSEIHYYSGTDSKNQNPNGVNKDSDYRELWNLVFIQYNRESDGSLSDLPLKHVDTGLGLERITSVMNNTTDHYSTDIFKPLIDKIADFTKIPYNKEEGFPHRVISDHLRMLSFSIADGVLPSNEGRGYVVRRVLRRAVRYADFLGIKDLFLGNLVSDLIPIVDSYYPEIKSKKDHIEKTLNAEEELFRRTLEKGLLKFDKLLDKDKSSKVFSGTDVFKLYDTFGFPVDLTKILCKEKEISIDMLGFEKLMKEQKNKARTSANFNLKNKKINWNIVSEESSNFIGYNKHSCESKIIAYALEGDLVYVELDKTPFYFESGGQVADRGEIYNKTFTLKVLDVQKNNGRVYHITKIDKGAFSPEEEKVVSEIDTDKRINIMSNHTATHLLHQSLINILGAHIQQAGSLVDSDRLRFDFTHNEKLTKDQILKIENSINTQIKNKINLDVTTVDYDVAIKEGALALFGEKYSEDVRVVNVPGFSKELCGGTHVSNTSDIGLFKILSEKSLSSGVRRIEALTSSGCYNYLLENNNLLNNILDILKCSKKDLIDNINSLKNHNESLIAENKKIKIDNQSTIVSELLEKAIVRNKIMMIFEVLEQPLDMNTLSDQFRAKVVNNGLMVLGIVDNNQPFLFCSLTDNITSKYNAVDIVREGAKYIEGGGGGRKHFAKAGGKNRENLEMAISQMKKMIIG